MTLDITLAPIYRINGEEAASMPGLLTLTPSRSEARGREQDRLIAYLLLTGNSTFTTTEYMQVATDAAKVFYSTSGSTTSALRAAGELVNKILLDRNMSTTNRGQYALGWLTLAAVRDSQCTFLLSGPMHVYHFGQNEARHIFEPNVSGRGLGMSQSAGIHYAQVTLQAGDRLLFCGKVPNAWAGTLNDPTPSSLSAMRRRLTTLTSEDLNAVLAQTTEGTGLVSLLSGTTELKEEKAQEAAPPISMPSSLRRRADSGTTPAQNPAAPAHIVQPSAYAIPPQYEDPHADATASMAPATGLHNFPASIPRAGTPSQPFTGNDPFVAVSHQRSDPVGKRSNPADRRAVDVRGISEAILRTNGESEKNIVEEIKAEQPEAPREPSENTRRAAKTLARGIQTSRRLSENLGERLKNFLPRLLPNNETGEPRAPSNGTMIFMAILVPLVVVTIASVVYLRYGRSLQYETYFRQASDMRAQALALTDPIEQRKAWENVLLNVDIAESHRQTSETISLRQDAEANLDTLLGITRLQFGPAFSSNLGIEISRMAAGESDLFLLNAANGEVLRAQLTNSQGFQLDDTFNCKPGVYGNYTVGPLVDILAMPTLNSISATLLGVDSGGNLLYCAPGQVAQAIPLPVPDTNWGRVTAFVLENGNLYVLDAPARAVWVYNGKDGTFIDRPYFFFGGQTPEKQDVIDLVVTGDDLFMLHADGHLSTCSYSRIESVPTRCQDPTPLVNPFAAYQDTDLFGTAHFTQMHFTAPPDQSILLLDADTQGVMRLTPRSLELQNQFRPKTGTGNPIPPGSVDAVAISPNHVMYLAVDGQVYFATMP